MRVYIAGPYSKGNLMYNIRAAIAAAEHLLNQGHVPYIPHLTGFWDLVSPKPYEFWLAYDLEWLFVCDAVLRLPGDSNGADKEEEYAKQLAIPVFHSISDIPKELPPTPGEKGEHSAKVVELPN